MRPDQLWERVRAGHHRNIRFQDFRSLVEAFGYRWARTAGSHEIYAHPQVLDNFSIQPWHGQAKPYQVRQLLGFVHRYNLQLKERP